MLPQISLMQYISLFYFDSFWDRVYSPDWSETCYIVKDDLELLVLLLPHPECWDYWHVLSCPLYEVLGIVPEFQECRQLLYQLSHISSPVLCILLYVALRVGFINCTSIFRSFTTSLKALKNCFVWVVWKLNLKLLIYHVST